jgi:hypothetical protein
MAIKPHETPPTISTTVPPTYGVSRRRLLQAVGGACVVVVGGTLYRAYDQGVFNTGQGPAYDAWREWDTEAGAGPLALVRAAVLATNAHNTLSPNTQRRPLADTSKAANEGQVGS